MSYNLFLDDMRIPSKAFIYRNKVSLKDASGISDHDWAIARTHDDFVKMIDFVGIPNVVSFDHDLAFEHMRHYFDVTATCGVIEYGNLKTPTGKSSAEYLVKKCKELNVTLPICYVHSANEVGVIEILKVLNQKF